MVAIAGCTLEAAQVAEYALPNEKILVVIRREPMHPFLAEYKRVLEVRASSAIATRELLPDTGGYGRINMYRLGHSELLLRGFFEALVIDLPGGEVRSATRAALAPEQMEYLGAFDDTDGDWRFFHPTERPELALIPRS
jgi:hypothetical protein